MLCICLSG